MIQFEKRFCFFLEVDYLLIFNKRTINNQIEFRTLGVVMKLGNEDVMLLAGGRIRARRCSARSKRTKFTF